MEMLFKYGSMTRGQIENMERTRKRKESEMAADAASLVFEEHDECGGRGCRDCCGLGRVPKKSTGEVDTEYMCPEQWVKHKG